MDGRSEEEASENSWKNHENMELWHIFSRVSRNGRKTIERELDRLGIKPMELRVLFSLSREGATPMNSLSAENDVTGPWITGLVDGLERKGYVSKVRSLTDRRIVRVSITSKGEEMLSRGIKVYSSLIRTALSRLEEEELSRFKDTLIKIENALKDQND